MEWAVGLDVAGGPLKTGGTFVQGAVDVDMSEFPTLEAGFIVTGVVVGQGSVVVTASPPDVG